MKKLVSKTLTLTMIAGLLSVPAVQAVPDSGRIYLLYEDFNTMTAGKLPGALTFEYGTPKTVQKTTVDEENGDYAMKLTSGSSGYAIGMRLNEAIKGAGYVGALDDSDKITIEYDYLFILIIC